MVGSEVDSKYLGQFAKITSDFNIVLSSGLYKLLGLSTLLSRKLLRARKQRKLDPTRTTKSLELYHHIIWMSREGLAILQSHVLPELSNYRGNQHYTFLNELQVLALKLNASFLHIFVLFDHTYQNSSLAAYAYMAPTIDAFNKADNAANKLLSGSHPLRLSVKLEFSAFTYDCTRDYDTSRSIAKRAVDQAFASMDAMDDESFEDAMELVGTLAIMAKRGLGDGAVEVPQQQPTSQQQMNGHAI